MAITKLSHTEFFSAKSDAALNEFYSICRTIDMEEQGENPADVEAVAEYDEMADEYVEKTYSARFFDVLSTSGKRALHGFNAIICVGTPAAEVSQKRAELMKLAEDNALAESWKMAE